MIRIISKIMINSPVKKVWDVISAIERDPYFWKGMAKIRNMSQSGSVVTREVILNNSDKCYQKIILFPMEGIHSRWIRGSLDGVKDIMVTQIGNQTLLEVEINYNLKGIAQLCSRSIAEELRRESELALHMIKEDVEDASSFQIEERKQWADMIS